jgi:hypothetical protein
LIAANATFALNAELCVRRARLVMASPESAASSPLSGRSSTYRPVRFSPTTSRIGFANIRDFMKVRADGELVFDLANVDHEVFAGVANIEQELFEDGDRKVRRVKVRMHPKGEALDRLAKILRLYDEKAPVQDNRAVIIENANVVLTEQQKVAAYMALLDAGSKDV